LERLRQGTPLEGGLPDDLMAEVRERVEDWNFAGELARQAAQELGVALPESELGYMAAHVSALSEVIKSQGDAE